MQEERQTESNMQLNDSDHELIPQNISQNLCSSVMLSTLASKHISADSDKPEGAAASWHLLTKLLEGYPATAQEMKSTITNLQIRYPQVPGPQINFPDGPWPSDNPYFVHKTHMTKDSDNFQTAKENITKAGRVLDTEDEKYLKYVLCHPCGWSATSLTHHEDAWVQYIKHRFPHVVGLVPILDDLTWPEEVALFPEELGPGFAECFLLANATSFYFYHYEWDELYRAGSSLSDVYWGLRQQKWLYENEQEDMWFSEPDNGQEYDRAHYFPDWRGEVGEDGQRRFVLVDPLRPFIPHSP